MLESISTQFPVLVAQANEQAAATNFKTGPWLVLWLVLVVVLAVMLARLISSNSQMADFRKRLTVTFLAIAIAGLMAWSKWPPKFGVDLRGGINMVGSLNLDQWAGSDVPGEGKPTASSIIPPLMQRVNPSGTSEIMIRPLGADKIEITIPSADPNEADAIWDRLTKAGKLEMRIIADLAYNDAEHNKAFDLARKQAETGSREREVFDEKNDGTRRMVAYWTTLARESVIDPKPDQIVPIKYVPHRGHLVRDRTTGAILDMNQIQASLGNNPERHGRDFARWCQQRGIRAPQILVMNPDEKYNVEGRHLYKVSSDMDERGRACVGFVTTDEGALVLGRFTKQNVNRLMATILDDQLHSAANVMEAIYKNGRITGSFTPQEVDEMVINLKSGKLPVALNKVPISQNFLNSTLGTELKNKGILSIVLALAITFVFMLVFYRYLGAVACIALALNGLLVLALIMAINAPLTLTGLAGLVLSIGMAVDANVLIYERMREEMERGAALRMAIRNGFDKAFTTIVDSNLTTIVTVAALYALGTEQLRGFSVTVFLGVVISMFTAIYVARLIVDISERKKWLTDVNLIRLFPNKVWDFFSQFKLAATIALLVIGSGLFAAWSLGGKIFDQDLRGGSTARIVFNQEKDVEEIRSKLNSENLEVKGEKVDFSVSSFDSKDPNLKNREFKIDSNLQAWEGEGERFEQLTEILDRVFEGELKKNHLRVSGGPNGSSESSSVEPRHEAPQWRSSVGLMSAASLFGGILVQDEAAATPPTQDELQLPQRSINEGDSGAAEATASGANGANFQEPATSLPGIPESGGNFLPARQQDVNVRYVDVARTLSFDEKISGKGIKELLVAASQAIQRGIDEDQIILESPEINLADLSSSSEAKEWNVVLKVNQAEDADRIIDTWQKQFNQSTYFPATSKVGSQVADSARWQALAAIVASLIGIVVYIWVRFQNVAFGLAAVVALVHDVLVVIAAIAFSHWVGNSLGFLGIYPFKISLEIVAALLTVIGYSLNDTIVIFDRIREVRGKQKMITKEMVNTSISQTLSRTFVTSFSTFLVLFILYCFGGDAIHGFAYAVCVGVVVGTFSTIFIACPVLLWLMNTVGLNPGEPDVATES